MKKYKWLIVLALLLGAGGYAYFLATCSLDGNRACYDKELGQYQLEDGASLSVQVENQALADFLKLTWSELHPENEINVSVANTLSLEEFKSMPTDIMVVNQEDAAYFMNDLQNLGANVGADLGKTIPVSLQDAINLKGFYMVQNSVSGTLFAYNETLIKELGLADIKTFDDLLSRKDKLEVILPFSLLDQTLIYPFLTAGGWSLNKSHVGSEPGFDSAEFLEGLKFIEGLSKEGVDGDTWNYESAFYERKAIISLINDRAFADQYAQVNGDVYRYGASLLNGEYRLRPFADVTGYVVKRDTGYPSAAAEVLRILRLPEAIALNENVPVYHNNHLEDLNIDTRKLELIAAYNSSIARPVVALEHDLAKLARRMYSEVNILDLISDMYHGDMTPEEAQEKIVQRMNEWMGIENVE